MDDQEWLRSWIEGYNDTPDKKLALKWASLAYLWERRCSRIKKMLNEIVGPRSNSSANLCIRVISRGLDAKNRRIKELELAASNAIGFLNYMEIREPEACDRVRRHFDIARKDVQAALDGKDGGS